MAHLMWNTFIYPPGGYYFIDADKLRHSGDNLEQLISAVAAYRARRGIAPGNPVLEVNTQLCKRAPHGCRNKPYKPSAEVIKTSQAQSTMSRVGEWLRATWRRMGQKQVKFVDKATVKERAAICQKCPHYIPFFSDCVACSESLHQVSFQLRAGRDKHTEKLKVCDKFGSDLRVDVLLASDPVPNAPEHCWKRG